MEIATHKAVVTITIPCTVKELRTALNELDRQYDNYFIETEDDKRSLALAPLIAIIEERVGMGKLTKEEAQTAYGYIHGLSTDALNRLVEALYITLV
jgi:hypothetical protein